MNVTAATVARMHWGAIVTLARVTRRSGAHKWIAIQMPREVAEVLRIELSDTLRATAPAPEVTPRERAAKRVAAIFNTLTGSGPAALWDHFVNAFELVEKLESELARVCSKNGALAARAEFVELELEVAKKLAKRITDSNAVNPNPRDETEM